MSRIRTAALGAVVIAGMAFAAGAQAPAKPDSAGRGMREMGPPHGRMEGRRGMPGRGGMQRGMRQRGFGRGMQHGRFIAELNLTEDQRNRIRGIHQKYVVQFRGIEDQRIAQRRAMQDARFRNDTSAATRQRFQQQGEQIRQRAEAIRTQQQNEIRGILTAEQRAKWDTAHTRRQQRTEQMRQRMQQRRDARPRA